MTEEEAKTKWCPFARIGSAIGCNRYPMEHDEPFAKCIASVCMAWRSEYPEIQRRWTAEGEPTPGPGWERDPEAKPSKDERFSKLFWRRNPQGYCGLAGAPR